MNPEAPTDWKLMAKRLSFTNDDLTSWATHEDPCMGVLTEWFATHKSSEATRAVYIVLKEMNREDAAEIVAEALKAAGKLINVYIRHSLSAFYFCISLLFDAETHCFIP